MPATKKKKEGGRALALSTRAGVDKRRASAYLLRTAGRRGSPSRRTCTCTSPPHKNQKGVREGSQGLEGVHRNTERCRGKGRSGRVSECGATTHGRIGQSLPV